MQRRPMCVYDTAIGRNGVRFRRMSVSVLWLRAAIEMCFENCFNSSLFEFSGKKRKQMQFSCNLNNLLI